MYIGFAQYLVHVGVYIASALSDAHKRKQGIGSMRSQDGFINGVRTHRTQDTSDLRQFGTSDFSTSAKVSDGQLGPFIKCFSTLVPK